MKYEVYYQPKRLKKERVAKYFTYGEAEQAIKDIIAHNKLLHPNLPAPNYGIRLKAR